MEKHDFKGQYWMNITNDGIVTFSDFNNAKKMVAAGAALASMAAVSYLI